MVGFRRGERSAKQAYLISGQRSPKLGKAALGLTRKAHEIQTFERKYLIFSRRSCRICRQHLQKWRPVQLLASSPRMGRLAGRLILCLQSSARQFALISFSKDLLVSRSQSQADRGAGPSTLEWQRTSDSPMLSVRKQESRPRLNLGEQVRRAKNNQSLWARTDVLHRSCCCSYSSCLWWRYTSRRSSSFRQSMSIWPDVRAYKSLAQMAPEGQPWTKVRTYYTTRLRGANRETDALLLHQPSLLLPFLLSSSPAVTASPTFQKSLLSSLQRHSRVPQRSRHLLLLPYSRLLVPGQTS